MKRLWGCSILILGACRGPVVATVALPEEDVESSVVTERQLGEVRELREGVERARIARDLLPPPQTPLVGPLAEKTLACMAQLLRERRSSLERESQSCLVRASLVADVDPALETFLIELADE